MLPLCMASLWIGCHAGRCETIYSDNFDGAAGSLIQGRSPDSANKTGNTYTTIGSPTQLQVDGSGSAVTTGEGGIMHIALPEVKSGDVVSVTARIRPASISGNWIGVGFTDGSSDLVTNGTAWVLLNGSGTSEQGRVVVRSGMGDKGVLYKSPSREAAWDDSGASTLTLVYDTRTGNFKVSFGTDTLFERPIAYNDVPETPAPLSALSHVSVQWFAQNSVSTPDPGLVESLKVDVEAH